MIIFTENKEDPNNNNSRTQIRTECICIYREDLNINPEGTETQHTNLNT